MRSLLRLVFSQLGRKGMRRLKNLRRKKKIHKHKPGRTGHFYDYFTKSLNCRITEYFRLEGTSEALYSSSRWVLAFLNSFQHVVSFCLGLPHSSSTFCIFQYLSLFKTPMCIHVYPCWPPATLAWYSRHGGKPFLSLDMMNLIPEKQQALLETSPPHSLPLWDSYKQIPKWGKIWSTEIQSCDATFCLVPFFLDSELCHLLISGAKAFPDLSMSYKDFTACKHTVCIMFRRESPLFQTLMTCQQLSLQIPWAACGLLYCLTRRYQGS